MFTDPKRVRRTDKGHPETCNVCGYYAVFFPGQKEEISQACRSASLGCTDCKKMLAAGLIEKLKPFHARRQELLKDKAKVRRILKQGKEKALEVSSATIKQAREALGI
jgi:tryptophanyl-tRNA synthetase